MHQLFRSFQFRPTYQICKVTRNLRNVSKIWNLTCKWEKLHLWSIYHVSVWTWRHYIQVVVVTSFNEIEMMSQSDFESDSRRCSYSSVLLYRFGHSIVTLNTLFKQLFLRWNKVTCVCVYWIEKGKLAKWSKLWQNGCMKTHNNQTDGRRFQVTGMLNGNIPTARVCSVRMRTMGLPMWKVKTHANTHTHTYAI